MITQEIITINGKEYRETKSDTYKIQKTGTTEVYSSAVDLTTSEFTYIETDELLETMEVE